MRIALLTMLLLTLFPSAAAQPPRPQQQQPKNRGMKGWYNIAPYKGLFKVALPGDPKVVARETVPLAGAALPIITFNVRPRGGLFVVKYSEDPQGNKVLDVDPDVLMALVRGTFIKEFVAQYDQAKIISEKPLTVEGWVANDYVIEGEKLRGRARLVVNRERFILLLAVMPEETWTQEFEDYFFNSLKVPNKKRPQPPRTVAAAGDSSQPTHFRSLPTYPALPTPDGAGD